MGQGSPGGLVNVVTHAGRLGSTLDAAIEESQRDCVGYVNMEEQASVVERQTKTIDQWSVSQEKQ